MQCYLDMLSILELGLIFPLLVLQTVLLGFDKVLIVATVTLQPLGVQVDDVSHHGIQEVPVMGNHQNGGLPRLHIGKRDGGDELLECEGEDWHACVSKCGRQTCR